ncbi:hypothetical protein EAG_07938 [Camponotus floridanus]|uniref:Uncharacterized protein n=1 Tax=Camponotus floridanus TaxID=104421 RepID=E1ZXF3_CAMFO|nr:hypothetical protein EAG_07938 [Camponotus floridanus]
MSDAIYALALSHHESDDYCCRLPRRVGTFDSPSPSSRSCPPRPSASRDPRRIRRRRGLKGRRINGPSSRIRGGGSDLAKMSRVHPFRRLLLIELEAMRQR